MTIVETVRPQPHEFDITWHFGATNHDDYGLGLYYACESIYRNHDWRNDGKPTATINFNGDEWILAMDYHVGGLDPDSAPADFDLEQVREFSFYFVAKDDTYDGERADQSQRTRGGTISISPRWPGLESLPEYNDPSVPDLGDPYVSARVQASNIDPFDYLDLTRLTLSAFDVHTRYLADPHPISHVHDAALYVRPLRSMSGPLYAADGPIARCHQILESDRSGYRKHIEDHRQRPGDMVLAEVTDNRASDMFRGHRVGFRAKHYYMLNPDVYQPDEFGYHPKFEVSYRSKLTDCTVRWDHPDEYDLEDLYRELHETLINMIEWSGLSIKPGDHWQDDAYFKADDSVSRSLRLIDDPLPEIEDAQTAAVTRLWGDMEDSDRAVIDHLLTDGGEISPHEAAEETGYSYRTVRRVVDRVDELIDHTYGSLELGSKHIQQELRQRVHAAESNFRQTVEAATRELADAASGRASGPWKHWRRQYNASVRPGDYDHETTIEVQYQPTDASDEREMLRKLKTAWKRSHDDPVRHLTVKYQMHDGTPQTVHDLAQKVDKLAVRARKVDEARAQSAKRDADNVDWDEWTDKFAQGRVG